ncbi:MAG: hypothetical protein RL226_842, partial [Bacteroidota bacterium]
ACESYTSPSGAYTWTTSGQYLDIIPNTFNCDSLITINLTVGYPSESSIDAVACGSYTVPSGNNTYVESGTYFDIIPTQLGCDSLLTIHLVVNNSTSNEIDVQACSSYTLPSGNETVTESGDYFDIIPNVAGCDSLLTIHLEITTFDLTIAQTENQLTVAEANASYVWVNCPDLTPIENQTNQTFSPTEDGEYAVIVTINECSETSECFSYIYQNVAEESQLLTSIYPNPSSGLFFIDLKQPLEDVYITVFDFSGRTIYRNAMARAERIELSLAASAGMYWLSVESKGKRSVTKLMVD